MMWQEEAQTARRVAYAVLLILITLSKSGDTYWMGNGGRIVGPACEIERGETLEERRGAKSLIISRSLMANMIGVVPLLVYYWR